MKHKDRLKEGATPEQLAKLDRLRASRNELVFKAYISPAMMIVGVLAGQLFSSPLKWMNQSGFATAPLADVGKTKNQISRIRLRYLRDLREMQQQVLNNFVEFSNNLPLDEQIKEELKKEIYRNNPFNSIYMHLDAVLKHFPKNIENIKADYSSMLVKIAAFSENMLFKPYFSKLLALDAVDIREMINQEPLLQKIQEKPLIEIVALLKAAYDDLQENTLLKPDNLQKALVLTNDLSFKYALAGAFFIVINLMVFVFLTYIMEHAIHFGYKKWNQKNSVNADDVASEIALIESELKTLKMHANRANTLRYVFLAVSSLIAIYNAREQGPESFALYFLILNNLTHLLSGMTSIARKSVGTFCRNQQRNKITSQLDRAVECTGVSFEFVKGESLALDYLKFKPVVSNGLSTSMVNQIVKNVLFKNGAPVVSYEKNYFTIKPFSLASGKIASVNQKIEKEIERYQAIKKTGERIKTVLQTDYTKHIISDESELPVAVYQISLKDKNFHLESVRKLFDGCEVEEKGSWLFIKGYHLTRLEHPNQPVLPGVSDDENPNAFLMTTNAGITRRKQLKKQEQKTEKSTREEKSGSYERIEFPCGAVYDSRDPDCEVKKVRHPVFGENHFILFRIPESAFASPIDCKAVRNKINEAEFATSAVGSQGLQFRRGLGRDLTAPHARLFSSDLRSKHLGVKLGNIRPVAETERSLQNSAKQLHVFKGINNH
ncbi:MAG TPA: hypothetical protein VLJ15_05685 [Gammaproteobacteria bacterium]|nr:hypothetical protein [Gammaproteobacteria bacterium]